MKVRLHHLHQEKLNLCVIFRDTKITNLVLVLTKTVLQSRYLLSQKNIKMWSLYPKSNLLMVLTLILAGFSKSEALKSKSESALTHSRFTRGYFTTPTKQRMNFRKVLTLGESSAESGENNFGSDIIASTRLSFPLRSSRRVIRLGPSCETESQRFDPNTGTCYEVETRGPCGPLMIFKGNDFQPMNQEKYLHPEEDSKIYGHCECDRTRYERPIVSVRGQCHFLYSQAICDPGHFLVMDFTKYGFEPVCRYNPCAQTPYLDKNGVELVPFEGHCVKLNAPSILCPHRQDVVGFRTGALEPSCTSPNIPDRTKTNRRLFRRQITRTNELKCQEGYGRLKAGSMRCYRLLKISKR